MKNVRSQVITERLASLGVEAKERITTVKNMFSVTQNSGVSLGFFTRKSDL
jgi:hypothetical protein